MFSSIFFINLYLYLSPNSLTLSLSLYLCLSVILSLYLSVSISLPLSFFISFSVLLSFLLKITYIIFLAARAGSDAVPRDPERGDCPPLPALQGDQARQHPRRGHCGREPQAHPRPHLDHHPTLPGRNASLISYTSAEESGFFLAKDPDPFNFFNR